MGGNAPRKGQERLSALLEASGSVLKYRRFEDAARSIFDSCKKLIGATAGYVALLSRDGTENELLFLDSGGLPCTVEPTLPMPIRGLRAEAYHSAKTVYDNDFPGSEWVGFLPEGHAELHNVLFAPLRIEGEVVGLLGLANKPGGFAEDDARMAAAFGELAAIALHNSRTLEALENSEQRFRSLVETAADAIISADSRGNITLCNRRGEALFGYRAGELVGEPLTSIMPERFRDGHKKGMERLLSTGKPTIVGKTVELVGLRKDGSEFPLELSVAKSGPGGESFFAAVIRDISERKRVEEALRHHREDLDRAQAVAHTGSWRLDVRRDELLWSDETYRMFGLSKGTPLTYEAFLETVHPEDREYVDQKWTAALRGESYDIEHRIVVGDSVKWVRERAELEFDKHGTLLGGFGTVQDITEHKRAEEELRERTHNLGERVKELNCLYGISRLVERPGISLEELLRETVEMIPPAWQYPEVACARIMLEEQEFRTGTFRESIWRQASDIIVLGQRMGTVEVCYLDERPKRDEGPFLKEERSLIDTIARTLGRAVENKRAEESIQAQGVFLQTVLDALSHPFYVIDANDYTIKMANAATAVGRSFGPTTCYELLHDSSEPCRGDENVCPLEVVRMRKTPLMVEHTHRSEDGSRRVVEVHCYPLLDEEGNVNQVIEYTMDVTERKRAEAALQESEKRFRGLYESMRDGVVRTDMEGRIIAVNQAFLDMLGYTVEEISRLTYQQLTPKDWHEMEADIVEHQILKVDYSNEYEKEYIRKDGSTFPISIRVWLIRDEQGEPVGMWGIVRNITERRQAQEALERLRSEFTGIVTHELKTPLTAIKGSAATALGSQRPLAAEENRELFEIIDEQADRLRELMDNLLDVTRIEAGTLSVSPEPTDLLEVLEEARATFARSGGRHDVRLELLADMPHVSADRRRLIQVLMNLLNNGAMYSPTTEPITIAVEHDPLQVTVHVRDRGQGIPKQKLPLLFKKFSRVHDDAGRKLSGTGLGLAICKGIVEAHGGRIWAESAGEWQGATFSFTLSVAGETDVKRLTDEARRAVHLGRVRRAGEKTRVLAVDDEPQVLRLLQRSLDEAGYQPIVTSDPSQVAKLVEQEEPDLVLLDLMLPGTSGFELLQRVREFSGVPVIFVTASDEEADTVRALKIGADDYITKPFSPSELLARIGAALRRRLLPDVTEVRPPFVLGDLTIRFAERRVTVAGQEVSLSATEYKILYELATHAGRVLTHHQILQAVWGPEYSGETELVRSFIRNLRRKLGDDARHPRFILTERQVGYRMPKP